MHIICSILENHLEKIIKVKPQWNPLLNRCICSIQLISVNIEIALCTHLLRTFFSSLVLAGFSTTLMSVRLGYFGSLLFFPFPFPFPFFFLDPRSTPRAPSISACNSGSCQSLNSSTIPCIHKKWYTWMYWCTCILYRGETTFASIKII